MMSGMKRRSHSGWPCLLAFALHLLAPLCPASPRLPDPNLNIRAVKRSDVENALGLGTPQQAAGMAVALRAAWDVFQHRAGVKDWAVSLLIAQWAVDGLVDNAVSVALGDRVLEFHRQPDGTYTPPS